MKVMTINAQSLNNKLNEFKLLVNDKKPDIISITESWAKENTTDGIFALQGYTMYRDDKKTGTGGGALLYVNDKIEQRVCKVLNKMPFENSTWCWIIGKGGNKILVGSIYRSTSSSGQNDDLLDQMIVKANEIAGGTVLSYLGISICQTLIGRMIN